MKEDEGMKQKSINEIDREKERVINKYLNSQCRVSLKMDGHQKGLTLTDVCQR